MIRKTPWSNAKEREQELNKQNAYLTVLTQKAKACLEDPKFGEYVAMFHNYEQEVVNSIIMLNDPDPIQYAFKVRQLVDTLKAYRLLISSVQEDSARKVDA